MAPQAKRRGDPGSTRPCGRRDPRICRSRAQEAAALSASLSRARGTRGVSRHLRQGPRHPWHRGTMAGGWKGAVGSPQTQSPPSLPPSRRSHTRLHPGAIPALLLWPLRRPAGAAPPCSPGRRRRPYVAGQREGAGARLGLRELRACALRRAGPRPLPADTAAPH